MSNPCINRWGLNSMWNHYWYSDSSYSLNLGQDRVILDLTYTYLNYGTDHTYRLFWNNFWYKSSPSPNFQVLSSYYRWIPLYSEILRTTSYYPFRVVSEERFETRVSVLRYNSWFILNLYWLQPDKVRRRKLRISKPYKYTAAVSTHSRTTHLISKANKLILVSGSNGLRQDQDYRF